MLQEKRQRIDTSCFRAPLADRWPVMELSEEQTRRGEDPSLARNDAVIGISTNNTRIHHSHGNITQSYTVHVWRASHEEQKLTLNPPFSSTNTTFFIGRITFWRPLGPTAMLTATLASTETHLRSLAKPGFLQALSFSLSQRCVRK